MIGLKSLVSLAKQEKFENLGSSILKLSFVNKLFALEIIREINWKKVLLKGPTIRFDKFANSLHDLSIVNKDYVKDFLNNIEMDFILKIASRSSRDGLTQGLSKLKNIDPSLSIKLSRLLKQNAV